MAPRGGRRNNNTTKGIDKNDNMGGNNDTTHKNKPQTANKNLVYTTRYITSTSKRSQMSL